MQPQPLTTKTALSSPSQPRLYRKVLILENLKLAVVHAPYPR